MFISDSRHDSQLALAHGIGAEADRGFTRIKMDLCVCWLYSRGVPFCGRCDNKMTPRSKPKKKPRYRTITAWANVFPLGGYYYQTVHTDKAGADYWANENRIALVKLTGKYRMKGRRG